jgi:Flp pilus assembly protein TadG
MSAARSSTQGSYLIEFAFALPFLLLILVGIMEFSLAFVLRGKLANAAREGARRAVAQPAPVVEDVGKAVEKYLQTAVDSSISKGACTGALPSWTCAYSSGLGVTGEIKIERPVEVAGSLCCVRVTVSSSYEWHLFSQVLSLFSLGGSGGPIALPETLSSQAVMGM